MDIRRLEVFCKLMETRSFSKTGQELNLTQPTISGHIKTLEQQLGLRLFDRHRRQVQPTSAAEVLFGYAVKILDLKEEAGFALERFQGRIGGPLRLGGSTIPGAYVLPGVMGRFRRNFKETYLTLVLGDTQEITRQVGEGDIELGVVGAKTESENLHFEPIMEDQMIVAVPSEHPWAASGAPITVAELTKEPFIIREPGSGTRLAMLAALESHGVNLVDLELVAEMGGTEAVRQAVKAGLGVSILSRVAIADELKYGLLTNIPVEGLDLSRRFYLVYNRRKTKSPVCNAFIEFLRRDEQIPRNL
ncbi:MAG: selenium metabolism-associated LysR family transcriptional regulator [Pseudomonadota bacterium]